MKTCGILVTKENSTRFPGKNRRLFEHNLDIMVEAVGNENTFMFSDDEYIIEKCLKKCINIIRKGENIDDEMSYLDVLRYVYMSIYREYDIIASVQCNSIGHSAYKIGEAIHKLKNSLEAVEVRSFDIDGNQSGIFAFRANEIPEKWHHQAMIISNGKEIHREEDLI